MEVMPIVSAKFMRADEITDKELEDFDMGNDLAVGYAEVIVKIDLHMKAVAAERDKLYDTIAELEQLRDNCETAYGDLQHARDALSELV